MPGTVNKLRRLALLAGETAAEALWPTRCVLCERPGRVLCARCAADLPYLDQWRACPRCGAAYGAVQCASCDEVSLARLGRVRLPYDGCACATMFNDRTGRIVRVFKDQGERRLAADIACCMARCIPPAWRFDVIAPIPATPAALRTRGFDHVHLIAEHLADLIAAGACPARLAAHTPVVEAFARPVARDQRGLTRRQRLSNVSGRFRAYPEACAGVRLLIIDDVHTTGATLTDAAQAARDAGAACVYCMAFARV